MMQTRAAARRCGDRVFAALLSMHPRCSSSLALAGLEAPVPELTVGGRACGMSFAETRTPSHGEGEASQLLFLFVQRGQVVGC
jgi:hypothetical protein